MYEPEAFALVAFYVRRFLPYWNILDTNIFGTEHRKNENEK